MRVVKRRFNGVKRSQVFRILPLGDVHICSAACDERLFQSVVNRIKDDPDAYWIGMGDFCEFINLKDPRFNVGDLAPWVEVSDLVDLAKAQRDRFLDIVLPIADKCLAMVEGNHEITIKRHTERDVFGEIVSAIKGRAKLPMDQRLGVGIYGWLRLGYYITKDARGGGKNFDINLHHGFVGGRLAGAKALNMQRWLWSHRCDIALFGHSHNTMIQPESVEVLDKTGKVALETRRGAYTGTFRNTVNPDGPATYSEIKGYFPLPLGGVEIELRPLTKAERKVRMIYDS